MATKDSGVNSDPSPASVPAHEGGSIFVRVFLAILVLAIFAVGIWLPSRGREPVFKASPSASGGPYFIFERRPKFEPSAVARIGDSNRFLVMNDKGGMLTVTPFALTTAGGHARMVEGKSFALEAEKLEGATSSLRTPGVFYVTTSFDKPGGTRNRLIKITLDEKDRLASQEVLEVYHPGKAVKEFLGQAWSKVEALALSADESRILFGVRAVGPDYKHPSFRVLILSYRMAALTEKPEMLVNVDLSPPELVGRAEAISSLEYVPGLGGYLLLTSFEAREDLPVAKQTGGHLWRLPKDLTAVSAPDAWKTLPRVTFVRKPEGVAAVSSDGSKALVVIDDDDDRKSPTGEGGKFRLKRHQAVFTLVDVPK
ncbi:MAG: hypothetical protein ACYTFI_01250 [Planctomycetota bacterium]|jgi:hypothetical protein